MNPDDQSKIYATVRIPDIDVRMHKDANIMQHEVTAALSATLSSRLVSAMMKRMSDELGMDASDFFKFIRQDPEVQERIMAWRTARRLKGE